MSSSPSPYAASIAEALRYLNSEAALTAIGNDSYWPKWNSPWWHMLLLHEMGLTRDIPQRLMLEYVEEIKRTPLKIFPIHPGELPEGIDPFRGTPCHCQLGNAYQVMAEWGIDMDGELPWIRPWFLKYQMADGGFNCDNGAYLVQGECPSSMVGTIAAFEAVLLYTRRPWTDEEREFLTRGAEFLSTRKLMLGSATKHNAEERNDESKWLRLCFPRFYLYDVLRGLNALLLWSEKTGSPLKPDAISGVVNHLANSFPDGQVRTGRTSYDGITTMLQNSEGDWIRKQPATMFPLLQAVSTVGQVSPFLSQQWAQLRDKLARQGFI